MPHFNPHQVADTRCAMTESGIEKLAVFEALHEASAQEVLLFNPQNVAATLWVMTETGFERLAIFEALRVASVQEVLYFNQGYLADMPCAMTEAGGASHAVSSRLCVRQWPRMCCAPTRTCWSTLSGP